MGVTDEHNIENLGSIRWPLFFCLLLAWVLVVLFVSRGIQSTGKVGKVHKKIFLFENNIKKSLKFFKN